MSGNLLHEREWNELYRILIEDYELATVIYGGKIQSMGDILRSHQRRYTAHFIEIRPKKTSEFALKKE